MSFAQVFNEIESQTGMSVDYDAQAIDLAKTVSVPSGTTTVGHLLDAILPSAGYTYTVNKSHIIIKEKPKTQAPVLKGIVVDPNGEPVIGVGVFVKGTTIGTVTTLDGSFSINADGNDVLVCSLLGYKTKEVAVGKSSYLKIVLEEDALFISDVVVVGYGVQKKENLTGAVSVVSSKSIENRSNANLGGILQGRNDGYLRNRPSRTRRFAEHPRMEFHQHRLSPHPHRRCCRIPRQGESQRCREHFRVEGCFLHSHLRCQRIVRRRAGQHQIRRQ